jgi:hypothetical protein
MQQTRCAVYAPRIASIILGRVTWDMKVDLGKECFGKPARVVYYLEAPLDALPSVAKDVQDHLAGPKHCKECPLYHE